MIINYLMDNDDSFVAPSQERVINFANDRDFVFTFWNFKNKMPQWYSDEAIDLLYISLAVFAADRLVLRDAASDGWSREMELNIPVLALKRWEDNKELLVKMLSFLSGDYWKFNFRSRDLTLKEKGFKLKNEKSRESVKDYERICMFSGGLDSFVGAIDILERNEGNTLFISHYGGGKGTKEYQDQLKDNFIANYNLENRDFHQYYAKMVGGVEDTTRTRSFMFFAHAIIEASALGKHTELFIPENGLISLNIPLTFSRFGTSSTRTTHPYYLEQLQTLLENLEIPVLIKNPYQFYTKGEMLINCTNQVFLINNLQNTMSCSHPDNGRRLKEISTRHCGYCLPCVIRQAAIKRAGYYDNSNYYDNKFSSGKTAKMNLNSYKLGLSKYDPKYAFLSIQKSGPINENIELFAQLYIRGMEEVRSYLEE